MVYLSFFPCFLKWAFWGFLVGWFFALVSSNKLKWALYSTCRIIQMGKKPNQLTRQKNLTLICFILNCKGFLKCSFMHTVWSLKPFYFADGLFRIKPSTSMVGFKNKKHISYLDGNLPLRWLHRKKHRNIHNFECLAFCRSSHNTSVTEPFHKKQFCFYVMIINAAVGGYMNCREILLDSLGNCDYND